MEHLIKKKANKRGAARLAAVQALYQMEVSSISALDVVKQYELYYLGKEIDGIEFLAADEQWFRQIVYGVVDEQIFIDPYIHKNLPETWPLSRIDSLLRCISRAAVWELKNCLDVPRAVIISEYVDITKAFYDNEETHLINGLLHAVSLNLRSDS